MDNYIQMGSAHFTLDYYTCRDRHCLLSNLALADVLLESDIDGSIHLLLLLVDIVLVATGVALAVIEDLSTSNVILEALCLLCNCQTKPVVDDADYSRLETVPLNSLSSASLSSLAASWFE